MRGKGSSWSRAKLGADLRFYGWENEQEHDVARRAADEVKAAVVSAEPAARVEIRDTGDPALGVVVHVRVSDDDVATLPGGPMHRAAIERASRAAGQCMHDGAWSAIRLGGSFVTRPPPGCSR